MSTIIDEVYWLLQIDADGDEHVSRYYEEEMAEIFTAEQRQTLAATGRLRVDCGKGRFTSVIDMVHAARAQGYSA